MFSKALIVDDEEDIGLMVSRILTKEGMQVQYVSRVEAARQKLESETFQLYLLDLNLPDGTGLDLIPEIRKEKGSKPRIIVISAYDGPYEMKKVQEEKVDLFMKKPFNKRQLIDAIEGLKV